MTIWTISAQTGTGGFQTAAELARRAGVRFLDRDALAAVAHDLGDDIPDVAGLVERVGSRFDAVALSLAITTGAADAVREFRLRGSLPELGRAVLREATRTPAVVLAHAAFAALPDHPGAVHVRLRAPLPWRVAQVQREQVVSRERAEHVVRHDDHVQHAWVRKLYGADLDDPDAFSLVVDVSRFSRERVVGLLLAAAAVPAERP